MQGWGENDRGVSFTFGADVVSKFLNRHDLDLICRAHQVGMILLLLKTSRLRVCLILVMCSMYLNLFCIASRKNKMFLIKEL